MWSARGARLWRNLERIRREPNAPHQIASISSPLRPLSSSLPKPPFPQTPYSFIDRAGPKSPPIVTPGFRVALSRHYSQAQLEAGDDGSENEPLLPKVEEKPEEVIKAVPRHGSGKIVCKKARRAGQAPSIIFSQENGHLGGDKQLVFVETKQIDRLIKRLGRSFFLSTTFDLELYDEAGSLKSKERVLPRSLHLHSGTDKLMNVTFIRAPPTALLKVDVPLVFIGEDACPGTRKGGYIYTMERTVKYRCPGNAIPPFIEVDLSTLDKGDKILLKDLKAPPGISLVKKDSSLPVCKVMGSRTSAAAAAEAAPA